MRMVAHVVGALAGGYPGGRWTARTALSIRGSRDCTRSAPRL